ncbi:MAG: DegT/DnrJ/EryC1/StrS family aminotransferase [Chloroflexi bacterium]|nr:DegT/DnrJ/EryC1/StrS family aminotransferase [Chloroflexota bacterium]
MIPFLDLKAQYAAIQPEIDAAIRDVFASGRYILGTQVEAFEREFAAYCGAKHGVGVGSGTEAIHIALLACGIGPGDEVITVPNTAIATIAAIEQTGARPVLADVDATRSLDPMAFEAAITARTRAVVPVHLYGAPADLDPISAIARRHNLRVIEDAAQAHGATYNGRRVGGIGDLGCFSFYPTKNLGAYGDGGLITTNDDALADRLRLLRQYGWRTRDHSVLRGLNSRLDEMQAAILRVKLRHLDAWNARRRALAAAYDRALPDTIVKPPRPAGREAVYHLYVIESPQRDALRAHLKARGIETLIHYPIPAHQQEAYTDMDWGAFPVSEQLAGRIFSLPLYPEMDEAVIGQVAEAIRAFK